MREQILSEIRRLGAQNGGKSPGFRTFERQTGISQSAWRGVYWARWSDAVSEAGLRPNVAVPRYDSQFLLKKFAELCREFGRGPTAMEIRIYGRDHPDFPNHKSVYRHFRSTANMLHHLAEWTKADRSFADVSAMLAQHAIAKPSIEPASRQQADGSVYLIRWGEHYKIGRGENLERRVKQVRTGLPESGTLVHAIRTDDPPGIETYWHRRFADKRAPNGEWFKLSKNDVAAFKRRTFQ